MNHGTILTRGGGGTILFAEDFDFQDTGGDEAPVAASSPAPVHDAEDLAMARIEGFEAGLLAARHEITAEDEARLRHAVGNIAARLDEATEAAQRTAADAADAIALLLLSTLGAVLPTLCAAHGDAEAASVARAVLPALSAEPVITIRAHPQTVPALEREIVRIDPDLPARIRLMVTETMLPGDIRIAWQDGVAARDTSALWNEIVAVLISNELMPSNPS